MVWGDPWGVIRGLARKNSPHGGLCFTKTAANKGKSELTCCKVLVVASIVIGQNCFPTPYETK